MIGPLSAAEVHEFAAVVGASGAVCVEGARTQWMVGGPSEATRTVRAPAGVIDIAPEEMTVVVLAGTTIADLDEQLAVCGQRVRLDGDSTASIGGVLAVGVAGIRRRGLGPPRDTVLQMSIVLADGRVATIGGPTVKNVSGFDLCRLMVGSLGTLGCIAEVILRTAPRPARSMWFETRAGVEAVEASMHRPSSHLWDGATSWVLVEGLDQHVAEAASQLRRLGGAEVEGPPALPRHRWSRSPRDGRRVVENDLRSDGPSAVVEIGVGVVHCDRPDALRSSDAATVALHRRLLHRFDPTGRLNPERHVVGRP